MPPDSPEPAYLTTREVAELLRVKERKVYDLAAANEIPHRRITGKLLFPAAEIARWIEGSGSLPTPSTPIRPAVVTGSHDPLLEWALRESECGLATMFNGSADGLANFERGNAVLTGMHIRRDGVWNIAELGTRDLQNCVLISWARRRRGLLLSPSLTDQTRGVADLAGLRVVCRQAGAGARSLLLELLAEAGLGERDIETTPFLARTELEAASAIATGDADAALGIEAMAVQYGLTFVPLLDERFDLLIDRRGYFAEPVQTLLRFAASQPCHAKAAAMGGYDLTDLGSVRWLSA